MENTGFAFYLYNRVDWLSVLVATCTTLKSVLFLANAIYALVGFAGWELFRRRLYFFCWLSYQCINLNCDDVIYR